MMSIVAIARPGTVDHAADVSIELDVVQVVLGGFDLKRVFFGYVAQLVQICMTEQCVIVEIDLRIESEYSSVSSSDKGIDFE